MTSKRVVIPTTLNKESIHQATTEESSNVEADVQVVQSDGKKMPSPILTSDSNMADCNVGSRYQRRKKKRPIVPLMKQE